MKKLLYVLAGCMVLFLSCQVEPQDQSDISDTTYAVGDTGPSGVGIVFYITDGGLHGLEAAPMDQSESQVWIEGGATQTTENGNTDAAWDYGAGLANSNAIIAQTGHTGSAAKVCRDYTGGQKTDWFLPSMIEFDELFTQRTVVGGFELTSRYWTSSEYNSHNALFFDFSSYDGSFIPASGKDVAMRVRAVRAF